MKTLERSIRSQAKARVFWRILLVLSLLLIASPAVADILLPFETTMAAAFIGIVFFIVSLVLLSLYKKRAGLLASLADPTQVLETWEAPDLFDDNHRQPIPALFGRTGFFFGGQPYCLRSYDCTLVSASVADDEGRPVLHIVYTVPPSTRKRSGIPRVKDRKPPLDSTAQGTYNPLG